MAVLLGAVKTNKSTYKVGDVIEGPLNSTWSTSSSLFNPNRSYIISRNTSKIVKVFKSPYDLMTYQQDQIRKGKASNNLSHWTNKI